MRCLFAPQIWLTAAALLVSGCAGNTPNPTAIDSTPALADTPESTVATTALWPMTATRSVTRTVSPLPSSDATPTPSYATWQISQDFLFDNHLYPDCHLPCWQGLIAGQSGPDDINDMFRRVFGFPPEYDALAMPQPELTRVPLNVPPGIDVIGYRWWNDNDEEPYLSINILTESSGHTLKAVILHHDMFPIEMSVERILEALGAPSKILVSPIRLTQRVDLASMDLMMMYESGLVFTYIGGVPVIYNTEHPNGVAEFCLAQKFGTQYIYILEPIPATLDDLSPIQEEIITEQAEFRHMAEITDILRVTPQDLVQLALHRHDPCLYGDLTADEP